MPKERTKDKYAAPSVDGLLDVLELMAGERRPFGPTELSRSLGITNNLVFRIMRRLAQRGYADVDSEGRYSLGPKFMTVGLAMQASFDLRRRARRHLEALCERSGETAQIQVLDGDMMLCLDSVAPASCFYLAVVPGGRVYAHASAFGKNVLAFLPEESLARLLSKGLPKLTANTLTAPAALREELEATRGSGLSSDNEEYVAGVVCVGSPVFGADGQVKAGIGVTGLSSRMDSKDMERAGKEVLKTAAALSTDIGYPGSFFENLKGGRHGTSR